MRWTAAGVRWEVKDLKTATTVFRASLDARDNMDSRISVTTSTHCGSVDHNMT